MSILIVTSAGVVYQVDELTPGTAEVFTDEEGLLDLSAYTTTDNGDDVTLLGAKT